jgi:hypothetical protein
MRRASWAVLALAAACGGADHQSPYAIDSGTYSVTSSQVVTDGCNAVADYGTVGRTFEAHVTGDPKAWTRDAAFDLDGTVDRSSWVTGTFHGTNMGTSDQGGTYAAAGACVVLIGREMTVDLTADDQLSIQLLVMTFQAPFSPVPCTEADFPTGAYLPGCTTGLRLEARRL